MRLFIGVELTKEFKDALQNTAQSLKHVGGNFTSYNNYHLTLKFIGESDKKQDIINIIKRIKLGPCEIELGRPGYFGSKDSAILWQGAEGTQPLSEAVDRLSDMLYEKYIDCDDKPFRPHITIARRACVREVDFEALEVLPVKMKVESITLFESKRVGAELRYIPLYRHKV